MEVTIRDNILYTVISEDSCIDLSSYTFDTIHKHCFSECKNLTTIYLPLTTLRYHKLAFDECTSLKKVYLEKNNKVITSLHNLYPDMIFEGIRTTNAQLKNMIRILKPCLNFKLSRSDNRYDLVLSILSNALIDNANLNAINTALSKNNLVRQGIDTYSVLERAYVDR